MAKASKPNSRMRRQEAAEIERSAESIKESAGELIGYADRRTVLAADRTLFAAERTYAAWVRTALAALAGGIGARALVKDVLPGWIGKLTGTVLILFAGFCLVAAVWREIQGVKRLRYEDVRPIPAALLVPLNGFLLLVAVAALIGIWAA